MANEWLRLWHDMPNDPKWRTIARVSGQQVTVVLSVYVHLLVDSSRNVTRGHVDVTREDLASALDVTEEAINSVLSAMEGRVIVENSLSGWEKRQPKREDTSGDKAGVKSSAQRKKEQRERDAESRNVTKCHAESRNVTTDTEEDKDTDKDKTLNTHTGNSQDSDACVSAGSCCKVLVQAGISGCNPSHPTLLALIAAGANDAEFANAAQSALMKNKNSFSYVLGMVKKQREDAAGLVLHKGAMPAYGKPEKFDPVAFVNGGNQQGDGHGRVIDIN